MWFEDPDQMWHVIVGAWAGSCGPWESWKVVEQEIQDNVLVPCLCVARGYLEMVEMWPLCRGC